MWRQKSTNKDAPPWAGVWKKHTKSHGPFERREERKETRISVFFPRRIQRVENLVTYALWWRQGRWTAAICNWDAKKGLSRFWTFLKFGDGVDVERGECPCILSRRARGFDCDTAYRVVVDEVVNDDVCSQQALTPRFLRVKRSNSSCSAEV